MIFLNTFINLNTLEKELYFGEIKFETKEKEEFMWISIFLKNFEDLKWFSRSF